MFKKASVALLVAAIIIAGIYLFDGSLQSFPAYTLKSQQQYRYSFSIFQEDSGSQQNVLFGTSAKLNIKGEMTLTVINENEIAMKIEEIQADSSLSILKNKFPLREVLTDKNCRFFIENDGSIEDIYFDNDEDRTIREVIKNIVSLLQWKKTKNTQWEQEERLSANQAHVQYNLKNQDEIHKKILTYNYLSSFDLEKKNIKQINNGQMKLEIKNNIPRIIEGELQTQIIGEVNADLYYQMSLNFKIAFQSQETITSFADATNQSKESLSNINIKKIDRNESLKAMAEGITTQSIGAMIIGNSNPKKWFHKAIAQILLDPNSHKYLEQLFDKTSDKDARAMILDLLSSAGEPRFQKAMLSILSRNKDDQNYLQMIQRLALLNDPIERTVNFIAKQINKNEMDKKEQLERSDAALLYTYGSLARQLSLKENEAIFESLNEHLEQHNNQESQDILIIALGNTGNPKAAEIASHYLNSDSQKVREASVITLASVRSPLSKDLLLEAVFDTSSLVAERAMKELAKFMLDTDDYQLLVSKLGRPSEKMLGHLVAITEKQLDKHITPVIAYYFRLYNEGNYSEAIKRRMKEVMDIYYQL